MTSISRRNFTQLMLAASVTGIAGLPKVAWAQEDGDTLRIAILKATGNLDPHIYRAIWGVQSVIYDPLVKYVEGGTIEPGLAESWTVSDDGKSYLFKLREGAVFHDGTPADASAIEWNFKRWIGMDDHSWLVTSANYDSMAVIDPLNFQLNLKKPIPQVLSELSLVRPVRFLSPASVDADGKYVNPVGTGPWKVVVSDETHTLVERNEQFWGEKPAFSKIDFLVIPDGNSRSAALRAGEIDIAGGDYVSPVTPEQALVLKTSGVGVVTETGTNTFLRRAAAACLHRSCAGNGAFGADLRRAGQRPRPFHPRASDERVPPPAARAEHGLPVHRPRLSFGAPGKPADPGDVCRQAGRRRGE